MITTVGRIITLILTLLISNSLIAVQIQLKLTSLEGAPLQQAGVGQPFLLNVVVTDANNTAQYPVLKGIDNFHVRQSGFQMNMINGHTSITYHYRLRIDTLGNYTLGPAQLTHENAIVESEPITVVVAQEQKSSTTVAAKTAVAAPLMKLVCEPNSAYVGQKIRAELSFYTSDPTTSLQTVGEPELNAQSGFIIKNKQIQPITGTETINGKQHRFAKWNFEIYATKPGAITIPAYSADYTSSTGQPMLSFFFRNDAKRVFSNTVTLDIKPLPHSYKTPAFVGIIEQINAQIKPAHARLGEGMVFTITISGTGDFDHLGMLPLDLPDQLKWYESKKYVDGNNYTMEYIVQAHEAGNFHIPKQELYYFDTKEKIYKTASTQLIPITITGSAIVPVSSSSLPLEESAQADILEPINQSGPIQQTPQGIIPWSIFWITLLVCLVIWLTCLLLSFKKNLLVRFFTFISPKESIYAQARTQIETAFNKKNYTAFYSIMHSLLAKRLQLKAAQVSPEVIENSFLQDGLSKQALDDWKLFYDELSQVSFYQPQLDHAYYRQLVQKIGYWIDVLEKLPRVHV